MFILRQCPLLKSVFTPVQGSKSIVLQPWFEGTPHGKVTFRQCHQLLLKTNYAGTSEWGCSTFISMEMLLATF